MKLAKYILVFVVFSLMIGSCNLSVTSPKTLNCVVEKPKCWPSLWQGVRIDTNSSFSENSMPYIKISPVERLNTKDDEFQLAFLKNITCLTKNINGQQSMFSALQIRPDLFSVKTTLSRNFNGHIGTITNHGNRIYFAGVTHKQDSTQIIDPKDEFIKIDTHRMLGQSRLYSADLIRKRITNIRALSGDFASKPDIWEAQPAISPNGQVLFFASDRPHGFGGTDIWYCTKQVDGSWSAAINCGESVNSACNELTPFVTNNGNMLLFASCGRNNMGGYDLFSSKIIPKFWDNSTDTARQYLAVAENLRPPINTIHDELFPSSPGNINSIMYYSSNQNSTLEESDQTGFDLYVKQLITPPNYKQEAQYTRNEADLPEATIEIDTGKYTVPDFDHKIKYAVKGTVYKTVSKEPVSHAKISILSPSFEQHILANKRGQFHIDLNRGVNYKLTASSKTLFHKTISLNIEKADTIQLITRNFYLPEKITLRINFPYDNSSDPYDFVLDSNGIETTLNWKTEIKYIAQNILADLDIIKKIILVGHTDLVASQRYNINLAKKRVDFVISELMKAGVPENVLEAQSHGKKNPLPMKAHENNDTYSKRLRRVEFNKILNNK